MDCSVAADMLFQLGTLVSAAFLGYGAGISMSARDMAWGEDSARHIPAAKAPPMSERRVAKRDRRSAAFELRSTT